MKPKKSLFKRMVLGVILAVVAMANVFGIGFSTFMVFGDSTSNIGNISVNVGDIAFITIDKNNAGSPDKNGISSFICSHNGFTESGEPLKTTSVKLFFDILLNTTGYFNLEFTINQINKANKYPNFDFTDYVKSLKLSANIRGTINTATYVLRSSDYSMNAAKGVISTEAVNAIGKGVTVPMTIEYIIDTSAANFASDVFMPLYRNGCTFDLGIKVNG